MLKKLLATGLSFVLGTTLAAQCLPVPTNTVYPQLNVGHHIYDPILYPVDHFRVRIADPTNPGPLAAMNYWDGKLIIDWSNNTFTYKFFRYLANGTLAPGQTGSTNWSGDVRPHLACGPAVTGIGATNPDLAWDFLFPNGLMIHLHTGGDWCFWNAGLGLPPSFFAQNWFPQPADLPQPGLEWRRMAWVGYWDPTTLPANVWAGVCPTFNFVGTWWTVP